MKIWRRNIGVVMLLGQEAAVGSGGRGDKMAQAERIKSARAEKQGKARKVSFAGTSSTYNSQASHCFVHLPCGVFCSALTVRCDLVFPLPPSGCHGTNQ